MDAVLEVLRELDEAELVRPPAKPTGPATLETIQGLHHAQARLLAEGKRPGEVAAALGTSKARVERLLADPTFQELVSYYQSQHEVVFLENAQKAALLGRLAMDIMQERLELDGVKVPLSELRGIADSMMDRTDLPKKAGTAGPQAPTKITFDFGGLRDAKQIEGAVVTVEAGE